MANLAGAVVSRAQQAFADTAAAFGLGSSRRLIEEILIVAVLCTAASVWSLYLFSRFDWLHLCQAFDFWFDSDPARTISNITTRWSEFHSRSNLHPLYSLLIAAPLGGMREAFDVSTRTITQLYIVIQACCFVAACYVSLRAMKLIRLDALLGLAVIYSTPAAFYWIGFPEWTGFGAAAILVSVIWVAGAPSIRNHWTGVIQSTLSASMVVTSWVFGAAASFFADWPNPKLNWKKAYEQTRDAFVVIAALTVVQYALFPYLGGLFNIWAEADYHLAMAPDPRNLIDILVEYFGATVVAPVPQVVEGARVGDGWGIVLMTFRQQPLPLAPFALLTMALWIALWVFGAMAAVRNLISKPVVILVVGGIGFFLLLHALYGFETFLYALHFAPLFTFVALWGVKDRHKWIVRGLCLALIGVSVAYNWPAFNAAVASHNAIDLSWLGRVFPAQEAAAMTDCGV